MKKIISEFLENLLDTTVSLTSFITATQYYYSLNYVTEAHTQTKNFFSVIIS